MNKIELYSKEVEENILGCILVFEESQKYIKQLTDKDFYIELNDNMVLLYDSYTRFNYRFMYMLAKVWIDSYTIDNDYYTTITFEGDDYTVTSYKRRGKTIHKKLIS